jgi:hypothetical protein
MVPQFLLSQKLSDKYKAYTQTESRRASTLRQLDVGLVNRLLLLSLDDDDW